MAHEERLKKQGNKKERCSRVVSRNEINKNYYVVRFGATFPLKKNKNFSQRYDGPNVDPTFP